MSKDKEDRAYLWDMLAAARTVSEFIQGKTLKDYQENLMLRSAVERQVEIIGEAARKVSRIFKVENPQIPWRPIQAPLIMSDRLRLVNYRSCRFLNGCGPIQTRNLNNQSLLWTPKTGQVP